MQYHLRKITLATRIALNPAFARDPRAFAAKHHVDIVGSPAPQTNFKKFDKAVGRTENYETNVHFFREDAIRLFIQHERDRATLTSIALDPALLLHGDGHHPLEDEDLAAAERMLVAAVTPLLEHPEDACRIWPGRAATNNHITYCSGIVTETMVPGVDVRCLHELCHPWLGKEQGSKPERLKLGDKKKHGGELVLENANWQAPGSPAVRMEGMRATLELKSRMLADHAKPPGRIALIDKAPRLVAIDMPMLNQLHEAFSSRLEGYHLPITAECTDKQKTTTILLASAFTKLPVEELLSWYVDAARPSKPTETKIREKLQRGLGSLKPVPACTLFA